MHGGGDELGGGDGVGVGVGVVTSVGDAVGATSGGTTAPDGGPGGDIDGDAGGGAPVGESLGDDGVLVGVGVLGLGDGLGVPEGEEPGGPVEQLWDGVGVLGYQVDPGWVLGLG